MRCTKCSLYKDSKYGKYSCVNMEGVGDCNKNIMFVGEVVGINELKENNPIGGTPGSLLRTNLYKVGLDMSDIYITNLVKCASLKRPPTDNELKACTQYLDKEIANLKPKVIVSLGNRTTSFFLDQSGITRLRGKEIWSDKYNCWIFPMYHPNYLTRFNKNAVQHTEFMMDLTKIIKLTNKEQKENRETIVKVADTIDKVKKAFVYLTKQKECSFDLETTSLDFLTGKILCGQFSTKKGTAIVIPFQDIRVFNLAEQKIVKKEFQNFCKLPKIKKVAQNGKFDIKFLIYNGIQVRGFYFDTMLASYLLNEESKHSLSELALVYTDMGNFKDELRDYITGKKKISYTVQKKKKIIPTQFDLFREEEIKITTTTKYNKADIMDAPLDKLYEYGGKDADATFRIYKILKSLLKKEGLFDLLVKVLMPVNIVLANMELEGIFLDKDYLHKIDIRFKNKIKVLRNDIFNSGAVKDYYNKYKTDELNIDSPQQLGNLLFDVMDLTPVKTTDKGRPSTDKYSLEILVKKSKNKLLNDILTYRQAQKFYNTYIKKYNQIAQESIDNRLHTTYKLHGTVTGRLSSSNPNLQNIPNRAEEAKIVRKALIASSKDRVLIEADYKQLEFRVFAHFTESEKLIALASSKDIHSDIARQIFKKEEISKLERSMAKTAVFGGIMYGGGASVIVREFGIDFKEAERIIAEFFNEFPKAEKYIDAEKRFVRDNGYVINLFGRKRRLNDIYSKEESKIQAAYRQAVNAKIQSTAADIVYMGMINLYRNLYKTDCTILLNIHDAVMFECDNDFTDEAIPIIKVSMEKPITLSVPLIVDVETGINLGEMYEYNI